MRNKKGSMELSVNSIVILVIAIVIMGLIIGFIRSKFSEVGGNLVTNEPDPIMADTYEPLTLSRESVSLMDGKAVIKGDVFNTEGNDLADVKLNLTCPTIPKARGGVLQYKFNSTKKTVPSGERMGFTSTLSVDKVVPRGNYVCTMSAINTTVVGGAVYKIIPGINSKDVIVQIN